MVNVSYYCKRILPPSGSCHHSLPSADGFEPQPAHLPQTPAARAAGITRGAMLFRQTLRSGQLAPDAIKDTHLCMDTYRLVCHSTPLVYLDFDLI